MIGRARKLLRDAGPDPVHNNLSLVDTRIRQNLITELNNVRFSADLGAVPEVDINLDHDFF
jgi:hypothetical protein